MLIKLYPQSIGISHVVEQNLTRNEKENFTFKYNPHSKGGIHDSLIEIIPLIGNRVFSHVFENEIHMRK